MRSGVSRTEEGGAVLRAKRGLGVETVALSAATTAAPQGRGARSGAGMEAAWLATDEDP